MFDSRAAADGLQHAACRSLKRVRMGAVTTSSERHNAYQRRRPESTALYEVVRDNLETLYGAIDDGALAVRLPNHAKKELETFLDCGLLCRGFARLYCGANLMERVLPEVDLRQWVLTFPFAWRRRLAQDGALLRKLTRLLVDTVHSFYAKRAAAAGGGLAAAAKSGAVTVVQRTSSDLRLNPHLHVVFLDGAYYEQGSQLAWQALGHLQTREVGQVLQRAVGRIDKHLRRHGVLDGFAPNAERRA